MIQDRKDKNIGLPRDFPQIKINKSHDSIEEYTLDDIEWITEYTFHQPIKMNMIA